MTTYQAKTKYDEKRARRYQHRKPAKHRAEMRLIDRASRSFQNPSVLDSPCVAGVCWCISPGAATMSRAPICRSDDPVAQKTPSKIVSIIRRAPRT